MEFREAVEVLEELVLAQRDKPLTLAEKIVLEAAWEKKSYEEVAASSPYSATYLQRNIAPPLWNLLTKLLGNGFKVGKTKLRYFLEQQQKRTGNKPRLIEGQVDSVEPNPSELVGPSDSSAILLGGNPPDISGFYGRGPELFFLREAIKEDRCVVLIGAMGIGKSALAAKLAMKLSSSQAEFDCVIWKSVHYAPLLHDLLAELIRALCSASETSLDLPENNQAKISVLIQSLGTCRCLLILDEAEAILQGERSSRLSPYGEQYADYQVFFRRVVEEQHQSCLLLTSRKPFYDLSRLQRKGQPARSIKLEGLGKEALEIFRANGLADEEQWGALIETHRGNPLDLQTVANQIRDFFGGRVGEYLSYKTTFVSDIFIETLDQEFGEGGDLTNWERQLLIFLAKELEERSEPLPFTTLFRDLKNMKKVVISVSELIKTLDSLEDRFLVELKKDSSGETRISLQPAVHKYILKDPSGLVHASSEFVEVA